MKINTGLKDNQRKGVVDVLTTLLADEVTLYIKTRNFHWNVEGSDFGELHKFFEAQYEELDEIMDEVAERIRALGSYAPGSLGEFSKAARLKESKGGKLSAKDMLATLLDDHEATVRNLRDGIDVVAAKPGDKGTEDFLTGLLEQHEKMAWMLRAYLG
jgi:starvation-inducible DNA-binding protein